MDPGHSFLASLKNEFRDDDAERWHSLAEMMKRTVCALAFFGHQAGLDDLASIEARPTYRVIPEASRTK